MAGVAAPLVLLRATESYTISSGNHLVRWIGITGASRSPQNLYRDLGANPYC